MKGFNTLDEEIKLLQNADDTTCTWKDEQSAKHLIQTVEETGFMLHGFKRSKDKTEAVWTGSKSMRNLNLLLYRGQLSHYLS